MRLWNYGVVIKKSLREPELFKKHVTKYYAEQVAAKLRSSGLVNAKVEVWSRNKIETESIGPQ